MIILIRDIKIWGLVILLDSSDSTERIIASSNDQHLPHRGIPYLAQRNALGKLEKTFKAL
jgi:hypothetical protein